MNTKPSSFGPLGHGTPVKVLHPGPQAPVLRWVGWLVLAAGLLSVAACDRSPPEPPTPVVETPVPDAAGATARSVENDSVPPAETVFPPGQALPPDSPLTETDGTRKPAQEPAPVLKPMPGQNNDHSAPLSTDR